jgi:hypothetical protein
MRIYRCLECGEQQAGLEPRACHACKGWTDEIAIDNTPFNLRDHMADVRKHPERYFRLADLFKEYAHSKNTQPHTH